MAETKNTPPESEETTPDKKSKLPLIIGLVLALAGGGGGFFAVYSGFVLGGESHRGSGHEVADGHEPSDALPDIEFVALDPLVVSLGLGTSPSHLRFRAQLEVPKRYKSDVERLLPRVVDVLNSYLRALEIEDLTDAAALVRIRAHMLRRIRIVTGEQRVNDLLIMEFVVN